MVKAIFLAWVGESSGTQPVPTAVDRASQAPDQGCPGPRGPLPAGPHAATGLSLAAGVRRWVGLGGRPGCGAAGPARPLAGAPQPGPSPALLQRQRPGPCVQPGLSPGPPRRRRMSARPSGHCALRPVDGAPAALLTPQLSWGIPRSCCPLGVPAESEAGALALGAPTQPGPCVRPPRSARWPAVPSPCTRSACGGGRRVGPSSSSRPQPPRLHPGPRAAPSSPDAPPSGWRGP